MTISADMVALDDEALLLVEVKPENANPASPDFSGDDNSETLPYIADDFHLGQLPDDLVFTPGRYDYEPPATWAITPRGEEIDLRGQVGGSF